MKVLKSALLFFALVAFCVVNAQNEANRIGSQSSLIADLAAIPEFRNHSIELSLVHKEFERSREIFDIARRKGYLIKGFYHTSTWKSGWKDVILQQLYLVDGRRKVPKLLEEGGTKKVKYVWDERRWASLLRVSTELFLNVAGEDPADMQKVRDVVSHANLRYRNKINIHFNKTIGRGTYAHSTPEKKKILDETPGISEGEYSTIAALHSYCRDIVRSEQKSLVYYFHSKSGSSIREYLPGSYCLSSPSIHSFHLLFVLSNASVRLLQEPRILPLLHA